MNCRGNWIILENSSGTQTYQHPLADIGAIITASMSQSVAAAEFRALDYVDLDDWSIADLVALFGARGIGVEEQKWIGIKKSSISYRFKWTSFYRAEPGRCNCFLSWWSQIRVGRQVFKRGCHAWEFWINTAIWWKLQRVGIFKVCKKGNWKTRHSPRRWKALVLVNYLDK